MDDAADDAGLALVPRSEPLIDQMGVAPSRRASMSGVSDYFGHCKVEERVAPSKIGERSVLASDKIFRREPCPCQLGPTLGATFTNILLIVNNHQYHNIMVLIIQRHRRHQLLEPMTSDSGGPIQPLGLLSLPALPEPYASSIFSSDIHELTAVRRCS